MYPKDNYSSVLQLLLELSFFKPEKRANYPHLTVTKRIAHRFCNNCKYVTDCSANIFGRNNYFYILSQNVAKSDDAQNNCTNAGGTLAELIDGTVQKELIDYAVEEHIPTGLLMKLIIKIEKSLLRSKPIERPTHIE